MEQELTETMVIGHRNPDTDSICSAICYAKFKAGSNSGRKYMPARAGHVSGETQVCTGLFWGRGASTGGRCAYPGKGY